MKTIWEVSEEWTWNASNDDKMKEKRGLLVDCYDGRSWPVVACGSVFVSAEDTASKVKACILLSSPRDKKKKTSKHALTIASSFGHVHAFLKDNERVLNELDKRGGDDQCLMLIKKPKSGTKQMLKSQSWANLSTSDSNLYHQLDGGFHGDSRKHHKYRMKRKQSDLQNLPSEGVTNLKEVNGTSNHRTVNQSNSDRDDDWHSEVMSEHSYLSNGRSHNNPTDAHQRLDNQTSQTVFPQEINNNKKLSNNSRMYRSHNDLYMQPARLYDINMEDSNGALKSDEFYQNPVTKREPEIKEDEELDPVSRSHSLGDLTTGLTLSLVGQRKYESIHHLTANGNNSRIDMSNRKVNTSASSQGVKNLNVNKETSPPHATNSKQLSLKDSRKYTSDINLSSTSRNLNNNVNNVMSRSKTLDKAPAKPRRSLPAVPIGDVVEEKKKHYAEMVKQRMSLQSSISGSSSRQSLLSPYSPQSSKNGTPQSDKEVSALLEPTTAQQLTQQKCNNNNNNNNNTSGSVTQLSDVNRKHDSELIGKDSTAPPNVRSCDSGTATVTSLSSTVDSGYLTNDADNDMYSSSSYTKSLQKSAQSLYSGNKLQVYSYGVGNGTNRRDSTSTNQRDSSDAMYRNSKGLSSTLPRTHPYNRARGDNPAPENKVTTLHPGVNRRHTSVVNISLPGAMPQMSPPIGANNSKSFSTSTPNNLVKTTTTVAPVASVSAHTSRPRSWLNCPPHINSYNSVMSDGSIKSSVNSNQTVNFTPNVLNHSVNSTSNLPSYQKPLHESARRHASVGSLKEVNLSSNVPVTSNLHNMNNNGNYLAPGVNCKPGPEGKDPHHFKHVERLSSSDVPVCFTTNIQSPKGENVIKPIDKENAFSNPTSPVIINKGGSATSQRKGSNSADLLANRIGTSWNTLTSPKSMGVKEQHASQNIQYSADSNTKDGMKNLHGNQNNPGNNMSYFPRSKLKEVNRTSDKVTEVRTYQNVSVPQNIVTSPVLSARLQENRFVPLQLEKSESDSMNHTPDNSLPAHYNTLPSSFKLQQNDRSLNSNEGKISKNSPSLFQMLQYHELCSVRLSVKDKSIIFNNLRLCECTISLPTSCKSPKKDTSVNMTPKGKYAQLGGPGSAFKPVKSQQGSPMIPVSMVTVADISNHLNKMCDIGMLQKGDIIIEVDEQFVMGESLMTVKTLLSNSGEDLMFTVARSKQSPMTTPTSPEKDGEVDLLRKQIESMKLDLKRKERAISELNAMLPWKPIDEQDKGKEVIKNNNSSQSDSLLNGLSEDEFIV